MRQETLNVYSFNELSDKAKEKARDWYREGALDYEWWDGNYEDYKAIGKILGINIEHIYFSGFSSQGDGAKFVGEYRYKKGWRKELQAYAPAESSERNAELHRYAWDLHEAQSRYFYTLQAVIYDSDRYQHSGCTRIEVSGEYYRDVSDVESDIKDNLRWLMDWMYKGLNDTYDWLNADEQVDRSIQANEYEFLADGTHH